MGLIAESKCFNLEDFKRLFENVLMSADLGNGKFQLTDENRFIINQFYLMINRKPFLSLSPNGELKKNNDIKAFIICGPTGTGKTTLLRLLAKMCEILKICYVWKNEDEEIRKSVFSPTFYNIKTIEQQAKKSGLNVELYERASICIDDVGAEPQATKYMGNEFNVFEEIIYHRYELTYKTFTFITSNLPLLRDGIEIPYDDRTISRLKENSAYYELKGIDFRTKK